MGGSRKDRPAVKVALGGIIAALMATVMLVSYFPYLTYAIPAIAGLLVIVPMIELSAVWALGSFGAAAVVVLLTAENEAKILFLLFFGYYPILKAVFEKTGKRWLELCLKFAAFNLAVAAYVAVAVWIVGVPFAEFTSSLGPFTAPLLLILGNIAFCVYDMGATRIITRYILSLHPRVKKLLK